MVFDPFSLLEEDEGSPRDEDASGAAFEAAVGEIPRETLGAFVAALFFAHVGLFAAGLGLMLVYFRGQWLLGGAVAIGGLFALAVAVAVIRWHESVREASDESTGEK